MILEAMQTRLETTTEPKEKAMILGSIGALTFGINQNIPEALINYGKAIELDPTNTKFLFARVKLN